MTLLSRRAIFMKKRTRLLAFLLTLCMLASVIPFSALTAFAEGEGDQTDAMEAIESAFSAYKIGDTQKITSDGYIGIPVELSIYFDKANNTVKSGYNGTPVIIYVVNTKLDRIGTDSDTDIITSMLDRGYVVVVLDYLNSAKAISPDLDWSVQGLRNKIKSKTYFTDSIFPSGTYYENHVVPAGYDISINNVFWEADKHGTEGTLEWIVSNWNNDFRGGKGTRLVKWVYSDGTRKKVDTAFDGTSPEWYNASGVADANGQYTKVKWTIAESITDCVKPDGSPIDLSLYINIIYPTNPAKSVPVMCLANSSEYLANAPQAADRPHLNGFAFNGYAAVTYDYLYVPMARSDAYGYYDGNPSNTSGAITGDQLSYAMHTFNDTKINTAAMRYLRYLALSDGETFNFDTNAFGYYGNSKGGWAAFLGEEVLQSPLVTDPENYSTEDALLEAINNKVVSFNDKYQFEGHHGETRYEAGNTASYTQNGVTIDGGERQPWLTYNGSEIISGAQLIYASNGTGEEYMTKGHAPTVVVSHMYDTYNAAYGSSNTFVNICRTHDIPSIFFEVPLGHTLVHGIDLNHGIDSYVAFFDFVGYHLRHDAVKVLYVTPKNSTGGVSVGSDISIKFTGTVDETELSAVTVTAENGDPVSGTWTSQYGGTEWTFSPVGMKGSTKYVVTVPATVKGDNGKAMGKAYTFSFITEYDSATAASSVKGSAGEYVTFTAPTLLADANKFAFRFRVTNDAANVAEIYAVTSFDPTKPDEAVKGALLGSVNLKGADYYEVDVTDYVASNAGNQITLLISAKKTAGSSVITNKDFESGYDGISRGNYSTLSAVDSANGTKALKVVLGDNDGRFTNRTYYSNMTTAFSYANIIKSTNLEASDYGRKFTVSLKLYDETSRVIQFKMHNCTDKNFQTMDYDIVIHNVVTKAGEWIDVSFDVVIYDMEYGLKGTSLKKGLTVQAAPDGSIESPFYVDDLKVTETVTAIEADGFVLAQKNDGGIDYKASSAEKAFTLYNGETVVGSYDTWKAALSAYVNGYILKLNRNYVLTDSDLFSDFSTLAGAIKDGKGQFDIDLNGYTITCANTVNSLFWVKNASGANVPTNVNVSGGQILIGKTPLITYESSTSSGAGKQVNFSFKDVTFGIVDGATARTYISTKEIAAGAKTSVKIALDGCTFNVSDGKLPKNSFVLLPDGTDDLKISYTVTGGKYVLSSQRWVSIQENAKTAEYFADASDKYTVLVMPESEQPFDTSYLRNDGYSVYASPVAANGIATYSLTKSDLSTKYGMIPEAYADTEKYPYAIFDADGNFLLASSVFAADNGGGVLNKANIQSEGEWYVVVRRNVTYNEAQFNNLAFLYGSVTIDLCGNVFTSAQSGNLFDCYAKRGNTTSVTVKNGTVATGKGKLVKFSSGTTSAYDGTNTKTFDIVFDGITFDVGAESTSLFVCGAPKVAVNGNLTFNDCTFDFTDAPSGFVFMDLKETTGYVKSKVVVSGGSFVSDTFEGLKIYANLNTASSIEFVKNANGDYASAKTSTDGKAPSDNIPTESGNMVYENGVTVGNVTTYTLKENPLATKYGVIPAEYADVTAYPFAVFTDGRFVAAKATWIDALKEMKTLLYGVTGNGKEVTILLRSDYETTSSDANWDVWFRVGGHAVIDLNNHSLTRAGTYFLDLSFKDTPNSVDTGKVDEHDVKITVKNGTLVANRYLVGFGIGSYTKEKNYDIVFDNVIIRQPSTASADQVIVCWDHESTVKGNASLKFNNCTFDVSDARPNVKLFVLNATKNVIKYNVEIKGGSILASSLGATTVFNLGANATAKFVKDENGKFATLTMPDSAAAPTVAYNTSDGEMKFGKTAVSGSNFVYGLVKLKTAYGTIPDEYASVLDYPFVYFDANGNFKKAHEQFYATNSGIIGFAKEYLKGNVFDPDTKQYTGTILKAYVVMRRDYEIESAEKFDNLAQIQGDMYIDLGGFTLSSPYKVPFASCIKGWSGSGDEKAYPTYIHISNGGIVTKNNEIISYSVWNSVGGDDATAMLNKVFTYDFNNVKFSFASGSTAKNALISYSKNKDTPNAVGIAKVTFNDCTFDYKTNTSSNPITVFNAKPSSGSSKLKIDVTVNGGTILVNDISKVTFFATESGSSVTFGKGSNGKYLSLTLANTSAKPTDANTFPTAEGTMTFGKVGVAEGVTNYTLAKPVTTAYGDIPAIYADANDYPFAVFQDGKLLGVYDKWGSAGAAGVNAVKGASASSKTVYVLLRRDYANVNKDTFGTFTNVGGTFVLDLGGNTFTRAGVIIDLFANVTDGIVITSNIIVKNGNMLALNGSIVASQYANNALVKDKVFNLTFNDVDFGFAKGATTANLMWVVWDNSRDIPGGTVNAVFNNCNFDLTTNAPSGKIYVFNFDDKYDSINVNATVNGGSFSASSVANVVMFKSDGENDTLRIGKYESKYPTFSVVNGAAPTEKFITVDGKAAYFEGTSTSGLYELGECAHTSLGEWVSDGTSHHQVCKCGIKVNEGTCSGGKADCINKAVCSTCNLEYGDKDATNHVGSEDGKWYSENNAHYKLCKCGEKIETGTCSGGKADCMNKAVCSTCNLEYGDKDATNHVGSEDGKWYSENNAHYKLCKCGEKIETGTCSGGKADCMNKAVCSTCNLEYGDKDATNHVGSEDGKWYSENNAHYKLCKCGEKIETGTCSGGKADCMNKAVCSTCNLEYGDLDKDNHVGNSENKWISDGTSHYQECDCGTSINEGTCEGGEADCMNKAVCATCGNEYGELDNANHGADESEWLSDGTSHWYACQNGCDFRFNEAECDGGKATCVAKAVCATCENEYGEIDPEAHNLAENRSYDDFKHWFDCKNHCGQHVEEAPHEGGEATCTSKAQCDCGSYHGEIDPENHAPAEKWSSDGKKHWHECENGCGNALSEGNCYGGEATCSERAICEECGNEYGETLRHIHDYKYVSENGKHFKLCISGCGERYAEESCYGGTANCTEKAICSVCGSKYGEIDPDNHIPSFKMKTDGTHHWYECVNCGEVLGKEAHNGKATCVSAATCYVCGATFGEIDTHGHKAGSSWSSDGLKHWNECVNGCGAKMNYASHTGGTATCTEKAKCSVCGSEYGSLAEHTYAESWTVYGNKHWHECVCGAKKDEAEHSYGEWTVTKEATATEAGVRESKCVCGETLTQSIPAVSKPEKGNSMGAGSVAAIALGATAVAGAGAAIVTGAVTGKKKKKQ